MKRWLLFCAALLATGNAPAAPDPGPTASPGPRMVARKDLKKYSDLQHLLYPDKPIVYDQVIQWSGVQNEYSVDEIRDAQAPLPTKSFDYAGRRSENLKKRPWDAPIPRDAIPAGLAFKQLDEYEATHPTATPAPVVPPAAPLAKSAKPSKRSKPLRQVIKDDYGDVPYYWAAELRDVEENGAEKKRKLIDQDAESAQAKAYETSRTRDRTFAEGFMLPRIRQSWRDVLETEDPSQGSTGKTLTDLVGATFSYARNGRSDSDTWTAVGALIVPWQHFYMLPTQDDPLKVTALSVAPSVSIDRVDSNDTATKEIDTLVARLGIATDVRWSGMPFSLLQLRAAGAYATDTGGRARLPGAEADIELRTILSDLLPGSVFNGLSAEGKEAISYLRLGYDTVLIHKAPLLDTEADHSALDYQVRAWLHLEGGEVQDNGASWDTSKGDFFRLGPAVQFQLNAPSVLFGKDASLTALYTYLATVKGSDRHNSFLKLTLVYDLLKDKNLNHKISLNLEYQRGGLDLTKQDVDTLTAGLGVLF